MRLEQIRAALVRAGPGAVLRDARLPAAMAPAGLPGAGDGLVAADLWLAGGRIEAVAEPGRPGDGRPEITLARSMAWALTVDCHTHVDKGQSWDRTPNPDGSFDGALAAGEGLAPAGADIDDVRERTRFVLDCAVAHGTAALRSHVDMDSEGSERVMAALSEIAGDYADRLHVQLAPFFGINRPPGLAEHAARLASGPTGSGVLSAFLYRDPRLQSFLDRVFALAQHYGLELDFHADETLDPASHCLRGVAETALRVGFEAPILVGHACSLSVQRPDQLTRTLDLAAQAGLGIVALPLCNIYLQDRGRVGPRQRGIAPVHEIAAHGIPVAIGSDNVRDRFHGYGDMDLPEVFRQALPLMHLDHPVGQWPATISTTPAALIGRSDLGRLRPGAAADLMIFAARNWSEFGARPAHRIVVRGGAVQDMEPPDFARLDHLTGMSA